MGLLDFLLYNCECGCEDLTVVEIERAGTDGNISLVGMKCDNCSEEVEFEFIKE